MASATRRHFLQAALGGALGLGAAGCSGNAAPGHATGAAQPVPGDGRVGTLPFVGEGAVPLDTPFGDGLDGRLFGDLSSLAADTLITPAERFFIRTRCPDLLDQTSPWKIRIEGLVRQRKILLLDDLRPLVRPAGVHLMECSGNTAGGRFGMLNAASWSGIPMARLLAMAEPTSRAKRVLVSGFDTYSRPSEHRSTPGASWIFTPEQLRKAGAFLATEMNGAALSPDHGAPVRLVVPGWYGCTCAKWVDEIRFVEDEVPSTPQMREFAGRTHQNGVPRLARDYRPAAIEQAAMAVRVEQRRLQGRPSYRVVGVTWGGQRLTQGLVIRFNPDEEYRPVQVLAAPQEKTTWALWACDWQPLRPGLYAIQLQLNDARVPKRRLDRGHYTRTVQVADV